MTSHPHGRRPRRRVARSGEDDPKGACPDEHSRAHGARAERRRGGGGARSHPVSARRAARLGLCARAGQARRGRPRGRRAGADHQRGRGRPRPARRRALRRALGRAAARRRQGHRRLGLLRARALDRGGRGLLRPADVAAARLRGPVVRQGRLPRPRLQRPRLAPRPRGTPDGSSPSARPHGPVRRRRRRRRRRHRLRRRRRHAGQRALPAGRERASCWRPARTSSRDDYVNDEWAAFSQMAWLDDAHHVRARGGSPRTSRTCRRGSSRRSAARPTHWAGAARGSRTTSSGSAPSYGADRRRQPARLADRRWPTSRPTTTRPRTGIGSTHTQRPPAAAGQQQLQGVRQRRRAASATRTTPPGRTAPTPSRTTAGRRRSRTASTSRATSTASKWSTLVREIPKAAATGKLDLRPDSARGADHPRRAAAGSTRCVYLDADGNAAPAAGAGRSAWPATRSRSPRLLLLSSSRAAPRRPGELLRPGRAQLHAPH